MSAGCLHRSGYECGCCSLQECSKCERTVAAGSLYEIKTVAWYCAPCAAAGCGYQNHGMPCLVKRD